MRVIAVVTLQADHGHVAAATLFGLNEVPTVRSSHLQRGRYKRKFRPLRAVRSAYAVGNPMGSQTQHSRCVRCNVREDIVLRLYKSHMALGDAFLLLKARKRPR